MNAVQLWSLGGLWKAVKDTWNSTTGNIDEQITWVSDGDIQPGDTETNKKAGVRLVLIPVVFLTLILIAFNSLSAKSRW